MYVDNDPVAVEHSQAILAGDDRTAVVQADLRDPDAVLADPAVRAMLDFSRPTAVLMVAVLHFVPDEDDPAGLVARFRDADAGRKLPGPLPRDGRRAGRPGGRAPRPLPADRDADDHAARDQIEQLFDGWELVPPGLVYLPQWRPEPGTPADGPAGADARAGRGGAQAVTCG